MKKLFWDCDNYIEHFIKNIEVSIKCINEIAKGNYIISNFILMIFHIVHALWPCDLTSHSFWNYHKH